MHPVLASSVTVAAFMLLLFHALIMKPVYQAAALIYEQPEPVRLVGEALPGTFDSGRYDSFLQEQILAMERPDTISAALGTIPRSMWAEYGTSQQAAIDGVLANLKVDRVTTTYQVALTLKGSDPRKVTEVVNAIASTYLDSVHRKRLTESEERAALLAEEQQRVSAELRSTQQEQSALAASLGIANPSGEGDPYAVELAALREQSIKARSAHDAVEAEMASLSGRQGASGSALAAAGDEVIVGDAGLSTLKSSISERRAALNEQMSGMTLNNPLRERDEEELAGLDRSLEEMTVRLRTKAERNLQEKVRADLQRTGDLQSRINAELLQRTADATNSTPKLQRAAEINADLHRLMLRRAEIDDASRSLQLELNRPGTARLALAAQVPVAPEKNRQHLFLIASFPLAFLLGSAAAVIACKCDGRIYTGLDVDSTLGFPPLAILRAHNERSEEVLEEDVFRMAGCVENAYRTKGMRTFLFTAVSSDIDIGRLSQMLLERICMMGTDACKVTTASLLLPVPPTGPIDSEIYSVPTGESLRPVLATSQGFLNANLSVLQERCSLVLIEASTVVDCAETEYVARGVDAIILVAESAVTHRAELLYAAKLLQRLKVPGVGVVLQGVRKRYTSPSLFRVSEDSSGINAPQQTRQYEEAVVPESIDSSASSPLEKIVAMAEQSSSTEAPQNVKPRILTEVESDDCETPDSDELFIDDASGFATALGSKRPVRPALRLNPRKKGSVRMMVASVQPDQAANAEPTSSTSSLGRPSGSVGSFANSTPAKGCGSQYVAQEKSFGDSKEIRTENALPVMDFGMTPGHRIFLENFSSSHKLADRSRRTWSLSTQGTKVNSPCLNEKTRETEEHHVEAQKSGIEERQRQEQSRLASHVKQARGSNHFQHALIPAQAEVVLELCKRHSDPERVQDSLSAALLQPAQDDSGERAFSESVTSATGRLWDPLPSLRRSSSEQIDSCREAITSSARADRPDLRRSEEYRRASQCEALEGMLTRQWSLLSRFQRMKSSGSRSYRDDLQLDQHTKAKLSRVL